MAIIIITGQPGDAFEPDDHQLWVEWLREKLGPIAAVDVAPDRITCELAQDVFGSRLPPPPQNVNPLTYKNTGGRRPSRAATEPRAIAAGTPAAAIVSGATLDGAEHRPELSGEGCERSDASEGSAATELATVPGQGV